MTLYKPEWFSTISSNWYELKVKVTSDATTFNSLIGTAVLYNGDFTIPTDISGHGYYSLNTDWLYLRDFQESFGGDRTMYPQLIFKNNGTFPATVYLDSVEIKQVPKPGD